MLTVRIGEQELAYVESGSGSPVVLVHGSVDDLRTWSYQMAPFGERHRTIAYSRRYHWPNTGAETAAGYRAVDHRDDLAALIETLGVAPAHLVGSSYGAVIAMLVSIARPALVRTLVLGEPPAFNLLDEASRERQHTEAILPALRAYEAGNPEKGVETFLNSVVGPNAFERFPPRARAAALDNAPEFGLEVRSTRAEYFGPLTVADLSTIRAPVLLVQGARSPQIFGRVIDVLRDTLRDARHFVVPDASHAMHRHNPSVYNAAVLDFLASADGKAAGDVK